MEYYGNKTWNNATDNADKSIIPLHREHFQKMLPLLEQSGLNFYAYVKDDSAVLAVNEADKSKLKRILGDLSKDLQFSKSARPYSPPQKNVVGNATYRYIPDKKYINLDKDTALKVAEQLEKANISYSGVIYQSGKATLTVSGADLERAELIKQSVIDMRRQFVSDKKAEQIIGNKPYREIQNRRVLFTNVTPEQYERRKSFLDSQVEYSGLIRNGKVMFTVDEADAERFVQAINTAIDMESAIAEMREKGFSDEQIQSVYDVLLKAAETGNDYYVIHNLDPRFTPEEFEQMTAVLERVLAETEIQRFREDSAFSEMIDLQKEFTKQAELREIYAMHDYSDEQKAVIAEIYADIPKAMFETADESYSPEELRELGDIVRNFRNYSDIEDFLNNHQKRLEISEENAEIFKALKAHKPVYLHKENSGEGYEFQNERIEYYAGFGFAILGDTDKDSDLVHRHFYTNSPEEIVVDLIQSGELARDGYVIDGVTAPAREEQSAEIIPETAETPELSETEQAFMNGDIVPFLAKAALSWDEIEDIGYRLYEKGYMERLAPFESATFGNGLKDSALFELAIRMQQGEDISKDLAVAILGRQNEFQTSKGYEFSVEYGENAITARHGNAEREISYKSIGSAMLDLIKKEYDSIVHDRTVEDLQDVIPGLSAETAEQLIHVFDVSARADWENNLQKQRQIKRSLYNVLGDDEQIEKAFASIADMKYNYKAEPEKPDSLDFHFGKDENDEWFTESDLLFDFVQEHGNISFALANALIEYLDEKQHSERSISELHAGWYKKTNFEITAVVNGEGFNYEGRFDIGDGKGTGGGSLIDHIRLFNESIVKSSQYPYNTEESKEKARKTLAVFVPFLEKNAELTAGEEKLLYDFKEQYPIRGIEDAVQTMTVYHGTTADFDSFKPDYLGAIWTDTAIDHAMRYAGTLETSQIMTCEAELHDPAHFTYGSNENWDISSTIREAIDNGHDSAVITFKFMAEDNSYYQFALENYPDHPARKILASIVKASESDAYEGETIAEFAQRMAENDNVTHCYVAVFDSAQIKIIDKTPVSELQKDSESLESDGRFQIYQLPDGEQYRGIRFESMGTLEKEGVVLNHEDYKLMYEGSTSDFAGEHLLEEIFSKFNTDRPADFMGHSLSVSDVIVTEIDGEQKAYYCDTFGFVEMPDFIKEKEIGIKEHEAEKQSAEKIEPKEDSMDMAIRLINEYCEKEFDTQGNFSNIDHVDLAYTTDEETELPIEVYADLETFRIVKEYNGTVVSEETFDSHSDMCTALANLEFDELVALSDEEKAIVHAVDKTDVDKGPVTMRKVGDFYEMYGKNAEIAMEVLGLHNTPKNGSPMVGFPDHVKDEYSKKLGEAGYSVLIEQAFELNPPRHKIENLKSLQDVVNNFFGTNCESAESEKGTWKLSVAGGDKIGELFYCGDAACGIYDRGNKMEIEPYRELETFPKLLQTAMLEHNPDMIVEIMKFQRKFDTPLDKAKYLINAFCESEHEQSADFSDLHNIGIVYTTLTDDELPVQVTADLVDFKITHEFNGEVFEVEQFDSLEDMIDNALSALDFSDLVSVPLDIQDRHTGIDEQSADLTSVADEVSEGSASIDDDTPLFTDDVIEELERNEHFSDFSSFEEIPYMQGEQLSLFGDSEPFVSEKPKSKPKTKSEFATGPVVDGVQVYEALAAEIMRGTGFENGKIRVQDFFERNNPTTKQLADFLKKEYGMGGHSGDGKITFVDYDSKGLTFSFENGEKFRHSWNNVATMVKGRLDTGTYLTPEEQEKRKALADEKGKILPDRTKNVSVGDRFRNKITGNISEVVSLTGALPHITEDCTVTTNKGSYTVTENIPYSEILNADRYEYLGNSERALENSAPGKDDISPDTKLSSENKTVTGNDMIPDSTRFTSLSAEDREYMEQYPSVSLPYGSPWGEVQNCVEIANGVFEVSTAGHGGVMIRADLAEHILSDEALKVGFTENGYRCYEEDADAVLPLRELFDKGIMDKEQYFVDKYDSSVEEMEERFNKAINDSIEVYFPDYWQAHENAVGKPFSEEIEGINNTIKYRITENKDEKYKYNVQVLTKGENGDFVYSGNGRFCETLDEARAFVQKDRNDRAEKEIAKAIGLPEEKKKPSNTIAHRNFVNLQKLYPEIFSGEHSYEKYKGNDSYEDFSIERYGNTLTLMHTFVQNGDLMYDPRIDYTIDFENQTLHAVNYEMSLLGIYQEYADGSKGQRDTDSFTQTWISNLGDQERYLARATALFEFEGDVHDIGIEYDEISGITEINGEDGVVEAYKAAKGIGDIADSDNFTITDEALGEGGLKSKFNANTAAIQTLKQIETEKRPATNEEKEILSRYVGWGGLAPAFESDNKAWANEHKMLTVLLTEQELNSARASTLDAFYTTPLVIDGIYEALQNCGFEGGNLLEPACGVGNFFGRLPDEIRKDSNLYGVEIDSISGRIAQQLYPSADITISGFEKNEFQDGSFDVVVGNVPFGDLGFKDERHGTTKLHDFFFAESLDKVKTGGIIALVTSAGTLDKRNEAVREMLAQQSDLIGAVRLPGGKNGAFKGNAGTEVTTDIIFLQKRSEPPAELPDWVHIGETEDGLPINKYYEQNPDMVLGEVVEGNKLYGSRTGTMVVPFEGKDLKELLHEAVGKLSAQISDERPRNVYAKAEQGEIPIPSNLRNYSFFEHDNNIYFKTADRVCAFRFDNTNSQHKRTKAFIELRDITRELLTAQELDKPDSKIKALQEKLNTVYDDFYKHFGLLHNKTNKRLFSEDVSYNLVLSLEKEIDRDKLVAKSDLFFKRTIRPPKPIEHVETAVEALTLSAAEKACVDFDYMSELTGMTESELKKELEGQIFKIPHTLNTYQTASEYLSGDIRAKLNQAQEAAEYDSDFNINVTALKQAMPTPLKAGDIDVKLGAAWVSPEIYQQFIYELLQTPNEFRADIKHGLWSRTKPISLEYSEAVGMFRFANKRQDMSVNSTKNFGTKKMNAYEIMEQILNLKDPKIYKTVEVYDKYGEPKEKRVVDVEATRVVQKKADKIRSEFKKWIFKDPKRREMLVNRYNELFNSVKPREYDGSHLTFPMMNADIHLHDHQKNAVAHALFGGNTLFAHSVGAGKTYEMIATAMESKRLGLCTKSMFAVPNHLTEQIGSDFRKLYPSANILVATKNDFKKENRQQLFAKIATGNFDAVIIGHSQLGMIPVSKERQIALIQDQINDVLRGIDEMKRNEGSKFQIKSMERTRKSLQKQLEKLEKNHDDTITFEQLGVDKLFVDEAHEFKNRAKRCA